jgi:two-component system nitrogen regulation sensor histidine kinase NtrY
MPEIKQTDESLNQLALDTVNLYRAAHESVLFELKLDDSLGLMRLDKGQIKRALINLFDNAVTAMSGSGSITVTTHQERETGMVCLRVADTGCGIDNELHSHLFEPYVSTKKGGTGLGLAIVHRIISDHGGFIRVLPNHPTGTQFLIEFPESLKVPNAPFHSLAMEEPAWS